VGPFHAVRVLVVDDDPDMRLILRTWIEQAGATVLSAADGARALEVARENKPDLVFCDLRMPRFDGYAFMDGFTRDEQLCHVPVLVLSGEMDPNEIRRTWEAGFSGHLVKPVTKDAVLAQIQRVLPAQGS
jgi:CheY-like chemotaxis protein